MFSVLYIHLLLFTARNRPQNHGNATVVMIVGQHQSCALRQGWSVTYSIQFIKQSTAGFGGTYNLI